jgi:hypothetical protein
MGLLCDPYVWEDPRYLFRTTWLHRHEHRKRGVCASELINEIVFIYLFALIIGFLASSALKGAPMVAGLVATVYLIPTFMKLRNVEAFRIQFIGSESVAEDSDDPDELYQAGLVANASPSEGFVVSQPVPDFNDTGVVGAPANPLNNVLVSEIKYAPTRAAAPDITTRDSKIAMDDFFRVQWYSDPTDVFGKSQSQREFITQPSTTIPNDQGSYQDWLYKIPGKTCKEGNAAACYGGTNGAQMPWLNL